MAASKGRWPLGRGFERFYGFLGGESSCWYPDLSTTTTRSTPPATPDEGYHIAKDLSDKAIRFIRDAKVVEPDKPFFMYFSLDAAHAPHHVFKEWADKYKGRFDEGYEAIRAEHPGPAEGAGPAARGHRAVADQPARRAGRHRPGRTALAAARHRAAVGFAERRREAAVRPDGRGVRRLRVVHRRPGRPGHRLPRGVRRARQHHHRRRLGQRCQRRGWPERDVQRVALLQRSADTDRADAAAHRRARQPASRTTTTTPAGPGRSTRPSRTGSAGPATRAASPTCAWSPGRPRSQRQPTPRAAVRPRRRRRADDLRPARHHPAGDPQGYRAEADRGRELRSSRSPTPTAPGKTTQFYAMLGQRSIYHEGWLACTLHPPLSGWGKFEQDVWELYDMSDRPLAVHEPRRRRSPSDSQSMKELVVRAGRRCTTASRSTTARRWSRPSPSGRAGHRRGTGTSTTRTAPRCRSSPASLISGRSYTIAAGVRVDSRGRAGGPLRPRRRRRRAQPLHQGSAAALRVQLGRHATCRTIVG